MEGLSVRKLADKYGVSPSAIQKIITEHPDLKKACEEKKQQNTQNMLEYLDARTQKAQHVLDLAFEALQDPAKYNKASVQSIATMMGIIIDKYAQLAELSKNGGIKNELLQSLLDLERKNNAD